MGELSGPRAFDQALSALQTEADPARAVQQRAYMKDQFEYFGAATPVMRRVTKGLLTELQGAVDWEFVELCWQAPQRELQHVAADHLRMNAKHLSSVDLPRLARYIQAKSWWDSVDHLAQTVSVAVRTDSTSKGVMREWSVHENLWMRRSSIICQLDSKEATDTDLLADVIKANTGSKEFFINKAIGWALRQYARTHPEWVGEFLTDHREQLSPLSRREAAKHLSPERFTP
ncbi:DNA alkylation repair protein [Leucobacter coleopterorum]|uniref:DNA alkylation repair protein n=1 Tax=Leucobacter coleopterorum TaxID=2714933 RepID=A0ABX6JW28_9MICO|nr:DNA alkylation repair protein [Leucobacter coleopterorum]QIM18505.1 DNA alkylation repair protein [Leucobacter coleopterorum]